MIVQLGNNKNEDGAFLPAKKERKSEGALCTKDNMRMSYENKPLISIITVVFNGEKYLEKTILSVINQKYENIEYIIIDGGSTDETLNIIKKYEDKIDYWVSEKDSGIYDAMNKGINVAHGLWIGFINAGDYYEPDIFSTLLPYFTSDYDILHGNNTYININQSVIHIHRPSSSHCSVISHPSTFTNANLFKSLGVYRTDFKIASDLFFYLITAKDAKKCFINLNFSFMLNDGVSSRFTWKSAEEFYILYRQCGYCILLSIFKAYLKPLIKVVVLKTFSEEYFNKIRKLLNHDYQ